jgi:hypothetical protein
MQGRWGEIPFAALTACLATGIAASTLLMQYWFAALALAAGILTGAAGMALACGRSGLCLGLGLCALALGGLLLGLAERDGYSQEDVRARLASGSLPLGEQILLDGCVLEDSSQRGSDMLTMLELRGFRRKDAWIACKGTIQLRVTVPVGADISGADLRYGDRVRFWAECDVPQNFMKSCTRISARRGAARSLHCGVLSMIKS